MMSGGCQCSAVRYAVSGEAAHHALCHCRDCRASSGAPATAWMAFQADDFRVTRGKAMAYNSSGASWRHFCGQCGTGLYFINEEMLPGIVDIQSATLDDAQAYPPGAQIQTAERLAYMADLAAMPEFERYPGP
ncbi:GFA family protein [Qipengyuania qiaonensis]|uniref:GFA family protein n=1 Tax=Qipengyuania qiaonensis TaxID=2867240 RepID=A0ABS7J5W0_9SPHN|nr:GFA family protein [Qipengyuania qiaonensis]MBX7482298.1 GFA family protein [Qipengyuania qiaonensis]